MKHEQMTEALEAAASQLGVSVRYEALGASGTTSGGGLCKVRGEWWLLIDKKSTASERAALLVDVLSGFEFERLELPPKIREVLNLRRAAKAPVSPQSDAPGA
jgi:hypothetical protein